MLNGPVMALALTCAAMTLVQGAGHVHAAPQRTEVAPGVHLFITPEGSDFSADGFDVIVADRKPSSPGLTDRDLGSVRHVVCASPKYFQRFGRPRKPQDLREHNCLLNLNSATKGWPFQNGGRQMHVETKGTLSASSAGALVAMALEGHGIVRVPHYAAKANLADKSLQAVLESVTLFPERARAYFSKAKPLPAKTADFVEFLRVTITAR